MLSRPFESENHVDALGMSVEYFVMTSLPQWSSKGMGPIVYLFFCRKEEGSKSSENKRCQANCCLLSQKEKMMLRWLQRHKAESEWLWRGGGRRLGGGGDEGC